MCGIAGYFFLTEPRDEVPLFNPDGTYRGSIQLPAEFLPMAVTRDMIIGSEYDELRVEYVVAYAITEQL